MTERTAEEWGQVAVNLPGWRWMPGMVDIGYSLRVVAPQLATCTDRYRGEVYPPDSGAADGWCRAWVINYDPDIDDETCNRAPDPDDPATAGCLLALLGHSWCAAIEGGLFALWRREDSRALESLSTIDEYQADSRMHIATTLGRACIAAAEALGRWPGVHA